MSNEDSYALCYRVWVFFKPKTPAFLKGVDFVVWVWVAVAVAAIIIEAASAQLISVWFALGAFGSFVAALAGANVTVQVIIFFALSVVALIIMLPLVKKITKKKPLKQMPTGISAKPLWLRKKFPTLTHRGRLRLIIKFGRQEAKIMPILNRALRLKCLK